jgi:hypothetical protein
LSRKYRVTEKISGELIQPAIKKLMRNPEFLLVSIKVRIGKTEVRHLDAGIFVVL